MAEDGETAPGETEESDQLPEEAPAEQVPDDDGAQVREEAQRSSGGAGDEDTATGQRQERDAEAPADAASEPPPREE